MAKKAAKAAGKKRPVRSRPKLAAKAPRQLKPAPRRWWQIWRPAGYPRLPSAWWLTITAAKMFWRNRRLFIGITLVYGVLNLILVQGLASSSDVSSLKSNLDKAFSGHFGAFGSSLGVFIVLFGSAGNGSSQTAGAYQLFLALVTSLAVIWALRQVFTGAVIRIRDTFYRGVYPLVPFILVLIVVGIQLLPLVIGAGLYNLVMSGGVAVHFIEKFFWAALFVGLTLWSLYMLSASLFALYIVTLPDMTPLKALRSAKQLVRWRRWTVLRKVLWLPLLLLIAAAIIMVPIIIWLTPLTQWVFFVLTMLALVAAHTYLYTFYRELLHEHE